MHDEGITAGCARGRRPEFAMHGQRIVGRRAVHGVGRDFRVTERTVRASVRAGAGRGGGMDAWEHGSIARPRP